MSSGISKIKKEKGEVSMQISHRNRENPSCQFHYGNSFQIIKSESSNSHVRDELKFERSKFITSGMDKRKQDKVGS